VFLNSELKFQLVFSSCVTSKHHKIWFFRVSSCCIYFYFHIRFSRWNVLEAFIEKLQLDCIVFFLMLKQLEEKRGLNCLPEENFRCFLYSCIILLFPATKSFLFLLFYCFVYKILYEGKIFTCRSYTYREGEFLKHS
jgi:hypothetical protein